MEDALELSHMRQMKKHGWRECRSTGIFNRTASADATKYMATKKQPLSTFERSLMRGLGLKNVRQLEKLLAAPISPYAADHSEPPDAEYELQEEAEAYLEIQHWARERFEAFVETNFLN
jgi:hypothetical protein